jgi:riboflavin synthase
MFTGLVEALGSVIALAEEPGGRRLTLREPRLASELRLGDSVAVNGACLTVVRVAAERFDFQLGPETLAKTDLGSLQPGDRVNLERSLRVGDRLDGHWVLGHVDGIGRILDRTSHGDYQVVRFSAEPRLLLQMISKGSVAVDGVSLTLVDVGGDAFSVMLIPHTLQATTLGFKPAGAPVNIEVDMLGKYVMKYMQQLGMTIERQAAKNR